VKRFSEMTEEEQKKLVAQALNLLAQWKPLPKALAERLGPEALRRLLEMVQEIQAQGLAGPRHRAPERLRLLRKLLEQMTSGKAEPKDPADAMPSRARLQQRGQESLLLRSANAQEQMSGKQELRNRRKGSSLL
jgi:uncharacterized membrane protein YccC